MKFVVESVPESSTGRIIVFALLVLVGLAYCGKSKTQEERRIQQVQQG